MSCTFTPSEYQTWQQEAAEHQCLKDAVIEAAKRFENHDMDKSQQVWAERRLRDALSQLRQFEQKQ